ncbi:MAG: hypothetical protein WED01_11005 [Candidatus Rokuibacteriota bacterium]
MKTAVAMDRMPVLACKRDASPAENEIIDIARTSAQSIAASSPHPGRDCPPVSGVSDGSSASSSTFIGACSLWLGVVVSVAAMRLCIVRSEPVARACRVYNRRRRRTGDRGVAAAGEVASPHPLPVPG